MKEYHDPGQAKHICQLHDSLRCYNYRNHSKHCNSCFHIAHTKFNKQIRQTGLWNFRNQPKNKFDKLNSTGLVCGISERLYCELVLGVCTIFPDMVNQGDALYFRTEGVDIKYIFFMLFSRYFVCYLCYLCTILCYCGKYK